MTAGFTRLFGPVGSALMALAALLAAGLSAVAETPSEKAEALLGALIKTNDPGLAVLVAQDGKILFEKGWGQADQPHHVPVIPQTTFCIASITKQFTASAILKLQEEGKLSVNDKLSNYFPDFPRGSEVTLRQLLTHTSGIHNYSNDLAFLVGVTNDTTKADIEAVNKEPYDFDPGVKWRYVNSGYKLLGYIVEKVSGQSYENFLRENFFKPLGMTNTSVYRGHPGLPHEALGYILGTNGFEPTVNMNPSWFGGAGALYSTVQDLYRWNEGIFTGRVLAAASLKEAFTTVKMEANQSYNRDTGYGFGWEIHRYRGLRVILHKGGVDGFRSILLRVPDKKFTVAILANAGPGRDECEPGLLAPQLVNIYLADNLAPLPIVNTNVSPKSYDALTGLYDLFPGQVLGPDVRIIITISKRDTHLFAQFADQQEYEIFPKSTTEFFWKGADAHITFVKDSNGKTVKVIINRSGSDLVALQSKDLAEAKVDPSVYDSLVGKYDYGNGDALTVTREGNRLFARLTGQPKVEIFPKSDTEYFWKVVEAQVIFVKDATGKVTKAISHQNGNTCEASRIQ